MLFWNEKRERGVEVIEVSGAVDRIIVPLMPPLTCQTMWDKPQIEKVVFRLTTILPWTWWAGGATAWYEEVA